MKNCYKFLSEKDLNTIEESMSLRGEIKSLSSCISGRRVKFFKSESYHKLFKKYGQSISQDMGLKKSDNLYITQLNISNNTPVEWDESLNLQEAYEAKSDLDIFSILIIGYWKVTAINKGIYKFSTYHNV